MTHYSWGLKIGNYCHGNRYNIPVLLSTEKGGFCLNYLKRDELIAESFIENVVLNFIAQIHKEELKIHLWDCAIHKRFPFIAELGKKVSFQHSQNNAEIYSSFHQLELLAKDRHKRLLDINHPTLAAYNLENTNNKQAYHLILINGDDYPDAKSSTTRWQYFFQAAATAGIFMIMFTTRESYNANNTDAWTWLKNQLPMIYFKQKEWSLSPEAFEFQSLRDWYEFMPLQIDRRKLLHALIDNTDYPLQPLLGESYEEYSALVNDAISDLQRADEEKILSEDIKNRLLAAAQHHQENIAQREKARRERLRLKTERLERLLEIQRQEQENEKRYQAMREAQKVEELAIARREEAEKSYYQQELKRVIKFKIFLNILVIFSSLALVVAFTVPNLYGYQNLSKISSYIAFSAVVLFFVFYLFLVFTYSDSYYQSLIKRSIAYNIYVMLAVNSLIFSSLTILTLYSVIGGNIDKFILFSLVNIAAFFIILILYR